MASGARTAAWRTPARPCDTPCPALCPEPIWIVGSSWPAPFPPCPPPAEFTFVRALRRYYGAVRLPAGVHAGLIARRLLQPVRRAAAGHLRGLPVLAHGIFKHAWGL